MTRRSKYSRRWRKRTPEDQASAPPTQGPSPDLTDQIYRLVAEAEYHYASKRYKQALAVCARLEALDPGHMTAEQMRLACERQLRRRRTIWAMALLAVLTAGVVAFLVVKRIKRIRLEPPPGVIRLLERESKAFRVLATFHGSSDREYTWLLLDEQGREVPQKEKTSLVVRNGSPWECTYTPPYNLVRAAEKKDTVTRTIVLVARDPRGNEVLRAQWKVVVRNVPSSPTILATSPPRDAKVAILVGKGERTFSIEAVDGDGGKDLTYEWFLGERSIIKDASPAWTYKPQPNELLGRPDFRADPFAPPQVVACRVANAFGKPLPVEVKWQVYLVAKNSPPQLVSFEPKLPAVFPIKEGERKKIVATVYDPDEGEPLSFQWEVDGEVVSRRSFCVLHFDHETTDDEKLVTLRVVVSDVCGASAEQSWKVRVLNAAPPLMPPGPIR